LAQDTLTGEMLRNCMRSAAAVLEEQKAAVNALNVFPVPDGDTGTNMSLTMQAAVREADRCATLGVSDVGRAISLGSLMGARGNSGVILSQLFRGLGKSMEGRSELSPVDLARAFQNGVETAYKAVMRPVEGTILTVAREMSRSAARAARDGATIKDVLEAAKAGAEVALVKTPDLLPVLKHAGVVDAGGKGLVVILDGMLQAVEGHVVEPGRLAAAEEPGGAFHITAEIEEITFTYDTQLLVSASGLELDELREQLQPLGDSMLVVGTPELAKVHIHTNNPGLVLETCLKYGDLREVGVENMRQQFEALKAARMASEASQQALAGAAQGVVDLPGLEVERKEAAVVAVAVGEGLGHIFRSLGVDVLVNGGQTMNPSTEELVNGIAAAPCQKVILLPNNTNIIMAAKQAIELTDRQVEVVPSPNIPKGIAALLAYNPQADLEVNCSRMVRAMDQTRSGEVTFAVRKARHGDVEISEGDVLGITEDEIVAVGTDPSTVLGILLERLLGQNSEFVSIFFGEDVTAEEAEAAAAVIQDRHPELEIEVHHGGQPLFYYLVSVE